MTQRVIEIDSPFFIREEEVAAGLSPAALFGRRAPLALEIGCGIGDFIVQVAERHPETDFFALDIYNKGCLKTCRKLEAAGLSNVRVLRLEARYFLTRYAAPASLNRIFINCPDPWPKKRHRSRRLVNRAFLQLLQLFLQPEGELFFSSDFADYAEAVAEELAVLPGWDNRLATPFALDLPGYPRSKYMRRFLDQGLPVHFLHWQRNPQFAADGERSPEVAPGYRLAWSLAESGLVQNG